MIMISSNFFFNFTNFVLQYIFLTKLLTSGILFLPAVRAVVVAKLVTLGVSFLTSFILALRETLIAMLVILHILFLFY